MSTLYACDLDGTLLGASARLTPDTGRILNHLARHGVMVTFITARTPATIEPILRDALPAIPGVAMTGASIWDCSTRSYRSVSYHRPEDVALVAEACLRHNVTPFVYTLPRGTNSLVVYHQAHLLTDIEANFVADRTLNDLKTFKLGTTAPEETADHTVLFFAMGNPTDIQAAASDIQAHTSCYASCYPDTYNPGIGLLEVFTEGVSKAHGLLQLKALTGADKVVAFGDNLNDIPMLQAADVAVAVENAHPQVKAVAEITIGPNTDDSVARFILDREL